MLKRLTILVGVALAVFFIGYCEGSSKSAALNTAVIDTLQRRGDSLESVNASLGHVAEELRVERDSIKDEADALKKQSKAVTDSLRELRAELPAADTLPVCTTPEHLDVALLCTAYETALVRLDQALDELSRKDEIIRLDAAALAKSINREAVLIAQIENEKARVTTQRLQTAFWEAEYKKAIKPKCGKKCGIVIGVLGTIGAAIGMEKVADMWRDE